MLYMSTTSCDSPVYLSVRACVHIYIHTYIYTRERYIYIYIHDKYVGLYSLQSVCVCAS